MSSLWIWIAVLSLLALLFLVLPLLKNQKAEHVEGSGVEQDNVNIFHERLAELDAEKTQGTLDDASYNALKAELEKSLLQDVEGKHALQYKTQPVSVAQALMVVSAGVVLIIASLAVYLDLGRSDDYADFLALKAQSEQSQLAKNGQNKAPDFVKAIDMLEEKLAENPADFEKSILLANSYMAIGRYNKVVDVYARLAKNLGAKHKDYARVKGSYAQALYQAQGEKFTDEVNVAIEQALAADAQESTALILKGIQAYMQEQYPAAIKHWQQAKVQAGQAQAERFIELAIADAQLKAGIAPVVDKAVDVANKAQVIINLSLAPELASRVKPEHTVFVYARAQGGRMPLAIERIQVKDLPKRIVLDESKAAMPTATIASVESVDIIARISLAGTAKPQAGDLFVEQKSVLVKGAKDLNLVINQLQK
jgi:cytochrome c-type biogenesis protein CcmH